MKTIIVPTASNVDIEYEVASLGQRVIAFILDVIFATIAYALFAIFTNIAFDGEASEVLFYLLALPWLLFYHLTLEVIFDGQSFGKMIIGIKVISLSGTSVSLQQYLMRWIFRLIDLGFSMFSIATLMVFSSAKGQRLGDLNANTAVIAKKPKNTLLLNDIAKIHKQTKNYEPKYPEVASWKEEDLLFIKQAIERYNEHKNLNHQLVINEIFKKCCKQLEINPPKKKIPFLKTLIKDYIALTR